ncbi:you2 family c2c2 zinc finger protein [Cystoisospora suis]|uniref:You2 family c2c2 zinc finger protein n=1 Tax=Cystoisospora suis TaxID=483139 RepID=A0A2C6LB72_9APIC|nr:you2 family c2c2 zinc finger protein [Cystoisospora suis]
MASSGSRFPSLEEGARQFQQKFEDMIESFTKKTLPLQKQALQCCVQCFDTHKDDHKRIGECMAQCHRPSEAVSRSVQREIEVLQSKLESCQKTCYNRFSQPDKTTDQKVFDMEREKCFAQCFTEVEPYLKEVKERVHRRIDESSP